MISIKKSNFQIAEGRTKSALKAILERYPEIESMPLFVQRAKSPSAEQLQIALFLMGIHVRVLPQGGILDIKSILCGPVQCDYTEVFQILSCFTQRGCWLETEIDKVPERIEFDNLKELKKDVEVPVEEPQKRRGRPRMKSK